MTPTDIDALQKLLEKATKGPWAYQEKSDAYTHIVRGPNNAFICQLQQDRTGAAEANARLIAAAPALLSEVKALREALRECGEHKEAPYGVTLIANAALGRSNTP